MFIKNVSRGKYAVAQTGWRGWRNSALIGDGITLAINALLTRCDTMADANRIAAEMNALHKEPRPGSPSIPVYAAKKYVKTDYLSRQDRRNGDRDCDQRII